MPDPSKGAPSATAKSSRIPGDDYYEYLVQRGALDRACLDILPRVMAPRPARLDRGALLRRGGGVYIRIRRQIKMELPPPSRRSGYGA